MIMEMANINTEDTAEKHQQLNFKLQLRTQYDYEAVLIIDKVKSFEILLRDRWMQDIICCYGIKYGIN